MIEIVKNECCFSEISTMAAKYVDVEQDTWDMSSDCLEIKEFVI